MNHILPTFSGGTPDTVTNAIAGKTVLNFSVVVMPHPNKPNKTVDCSRITFTDGSIIQWWSRIIHGENLFDDTIETNFNILIVEPTEEENK